MKKRSRKVRDVDVAQAMIDTQGFRAQGEVPDASPAGTKREDEKTLRAITIQGRRFHVVRHDDLDRQARLACRISPQNVTRDARTRTIFFAKRERAQIRPMC